MLGLTFGETRYLVLSKMFLNILIFGKHDVREISADVYFTMFEAVSKFNFLNIIYILN